MAAFYLLYNRKAAQSFFDYAACSLYHHFQKQSAIKLISLTLLHVSLTALLPQADNLLLPHKQDFCPQPESPDLIFWLDLQNFPLTTEYWYEHHFQAAEIGRAHV